jgi:hypothetical protein
MVGVDDSKSVSMVFFANTEPLAPVMPMMIGRVLLKF